jgi:hypothetical protein
VQPFTPTAAEIEQARKDVKDTFLFVPDGNGNIRPMAMAVRANMPVRHREKNVARNIRRPLPRFMQRLDLQILRQDLDGKPVPIAIVAGGPSARKHLDEIRKFKWVMAAGSSHDFLVENNIIPTFALTTDSKQETKDYFRRLNPATQYLVASVSPPSLFNRMERRKCQVWIWHFTEQVDPEHYHGEPMCGWGCMVGVVCIQMALWLGFQEQHYFGYDCCVEPESTHAYPVSAEEKAGIWEQVTEATVGEEGTKFLTTTALICCATHFFGVYRSPDGQYLKGYVYGPGMLHDQIRQSPPEMKQWLTAV